jgi:hypothetical protein
VKKAFKPTLSKTRGNWCSRAMRRISRSDLALPNDSINELDEVASAVPA